MGSHPQDTNSTMHLISPILLVAFAASSSAVFISPLWVSNLLVGKAGLAKLALAKGLYNHFGRNSDCVDEVKTILENVCTPVVHRVCEIKPEEECNNKWIPVCKYVDEKVCENKNEKVCHNVEKKECPPPKKSCSIVQDCHFITENKCKTENIDLHKPGKHTIEKCWDEQREVCTPRETCREVVEACRTVFVPKCTTKTVPSCKTVTNNVCTEKSEKVCHIVDKEVCGDTTTTECKKVQKEKSTGRQCCTVVTPETSSKCTNVQRPVQENVCRTEEECHFIPEIKCSTKNIDQDRPGKHTVEECWEEQTEICNPRQVCELVTKYKNEESCQEITNNVSTVVCE